MIRKIVAMLLVVVFVQNVIAQQTTPKPPVFSVEVEMVHLNVSVLKQKRSVTSLTQQDFAVFEDGVKQDIAFFNQENLPISVSFLVDTSASMASKMDFVKKAAINFIETLRPQDSAQVIQFDHRVITLQDFTDDHALLTDAVNSIQTTNGSTGLHNAVYVTLKDLDKIKKTDGKRRFALLLLSDGVDTTSLITDEHVTEQAKKSGIPIYCINIRGPQTARPGEEVIKAAWLMTVLSRETGGDQYFPNSPIELKKVYERIAEELSTQYNIGYVSSSMKHNGKWRRINVTTPNHGLETRHKPGYYAGKK